jgi:formylglycine-generating enzyme required for sulfatase activity
LKNTEEKIMTKTKLKFFYVGIFLILLIAACGKNTSTPPATGEANSSPPSSSEAPASPETNDEIIPINLAGPDIGTTMEWVDGSVLVFIPPGEFIMGHGGQDNPEHIVSLRDFWIYRTEVTNRMYATCVSTGNCTPPESADYLDPEYANEPITGVAWDDAHAYCTWIKGDLPTEAQWEKNSTRT